MKVLDDSLGNSDVLSHRSLNQRTIREVVYGIGIGVHSGEKVRITLRPAPIDSGIQFIRTDIRDAIAIPARAENVVDTTLATSIAHGSVSVATVEHLDVSPLGFRYR